jgi:hypothetical protein
MAGTTGPVVPVIFSSFSGKVSGKKHDLSWSTSTEINNLGFDVERSLDGRQFSQLGHVASKAVNGNSATVNTYNFTDAQPLTSYNYYRLKQTDRDGKTSYSHTILLRQDKTGSLVLNTLYPNPVKDLLKLSIQSGIATHINITITDASGRTVKQETASIPMGSYQTSLPVAKLAKGLYTIAISGDNGENCIQSFIKE